MKAGMMAGGEAKCAMPLPPNPSVYGVDFIFFYFFFCFPAPQPQSKVDGTQGGVITDRRVVEEQLVQGVTVGVQKGGR